MATRATPAPRRKSSMKAAPAGFGSKRPANSRAKTAARAKPKAAGAGTSANARKAVAAKRAPRSAAPATNAPVKRGKALVATAPSADSPHWTEKLRDGTHVIIRPIRKKDAALERAFIKRLSPEARRMRFLGQMNEPSDDLIEALTDLDYRRDMAFIALIHRDGEKQEIGVSRYGTSPDGKACECAVTVSDQWHNKGLGTLLMRHLIDVARARGVRKMISLDSADNLPMRDLAAFLGFTRKRDPQDPTQVIHTLML